MDRSEDGMTTDELLRVLAEDWALLLAVKERALRRAVVLRRRGVAGQRIARITRMPETTIRREFNRSSAA